MLRVYQNFDVRVLPKIRDAIIVNSLGEEMKSMLTCSKMTQEFSEMTGCSSYFEVLDALYNNYFLRNVNSLYVDSASYLMHNKEQIMCNVINNMNIRDLSMEEITNNPYLQNVKFEKAQSGSMNYVPGGVLYYEDIEKLIEGLTESSERPDLRFIVPNTFGPYKEDTYGVKYNPYFLKLYYYKYSVSDDQYDNAPLVAFPFLVEKKQKKELYSNVYMSVEPYEINTLSEFLEKAKGNVLMCGCGLGYAAYMAGLKEGVTDITILERSSDVINLFNSQVRHQLPKEVDVKQCDAYEFLETQDLSGYDCVYVDTWYCTSDMIIPYLRCLLLEEKYPNTKFVYWIEKSLLQEIRGALLKDIWTEATQKPIVATFNNDVLRIARKLVENSDEIIDSERALNSFISDESIRQQLRDLAKKYEGNIGAILSDEKATTIDGKGSFVKHFPNEINN